MWCCKEHKSWKGHHPVCQGESSHLDETMDENFCLAEVTMYYCTKNAPAVKGLFLRTGGSACW